MGDSYRLPPIFHMFTIYTTTLRMYKEIINIIRNICLRYKDIETFKYQDSCFNNQQNSHKGFQVYVDDTTLSELTIETDIFKVSYEIFIINSGNDILDNQDKAFNIAVNLMAYLDNMPQYHGILSVYDYSIMTLSHYTDDDSSGVKLSLVLQVPSPLSLCTLEDNFLDEPKEEEQDKEITVNDRNDKELDVHPIKLPRNNNG